MQSALFCDAGYLCEAEFSETSCRKYRILSAQGRRCQYRQPARSDLSDVDVNRRLFPADRGCQTHHCIQTQGGNCPFDGFKLLHKAACVGGKLRPNPYSADFAQLIAD